MELPTLYQDIVETSPDGIWVFDLEGRTLYANPALAQMFGVPVSELTALTYFDSLDEVGRDQFAAHLADIRAGKINNTDVESQFVRRDGSVFWVLVSESGLFGPGGELVSVVHRISDYSGRRRLLDELRTSRRRLEEAQRIARIGSWEWDVPHDEIHGSPELFALYGLDPASFPATYQDFLAIVHPDDRTDVDAAVESALDGDDSFVFIARVRGAHDWVWTRGRGLATRDESGTVVSMSGTHQDITEVKQTEEALQDSSRQNALMQAVAVAANEAHSLEEVLGQARSLVLLHDDWNRARAFVPSAADDGVVALLVTGADEVDGADDDSPEVSAAELALAARAHAQRGAVWDDARLTIAFPVFFGAEICAVLTITSAPPLDRHEMIQSMVEQVSVQLGRVAERERAERTLAGARDDAMEASRQKSEFLATMSHEIRTPLNGVIGLNDLLLRTPLDPDQVRLASGVQVASRALLGVINDVLDFSKIEAGRLELERLDFEIRPIFEQVASVLSESARAKGLELMISCHPDVPEVLCGDPTRLAQVLINLGSNALKFTEHGQVVMRAVAAPVSDGRTELRVEVTDTGVGLDGVDVDTLFAPFTQADASTTRVYGGTGLGLAISREIAEAMDGQIGAHANPEGGSVFWFTAVLDAPVGASSDPDDEYARTWLQERHVLVVDDNDHNRQILSEQLEWWRVRSNGVASAAAAMEALAGARAVADPFEAVLLDLAMPRRDGLGLAAQIRADPAYDAVTLLLLTSISTPDRARVEELGIVECLTKPVLASGLRGALLRHLAGVRPGGAATAPEPQPARHRDRVLVVEDNPVNQLVAVGVLDALGYEAVTADDGQVALDLLATDSYDLVLMDIQMPRMDGYTATREIRADELPGQRLPVIAMTAAAIEGERERCLAAGMDDFLTKPVDISALTRVLDRWLQKELPMLEPQNDTPENTDPLVGLDLSRIDELRDLDPGDTTYLDRAIGNFVRNSVTTMATIRELCASGDAEQLKYVSHKLAGGALNLGVTPAGRIAQQIEIVADSGSTGGAGDLVEELEAALEVGRVAVLAYQASYSTNTTGA